MKWMDFSLKECGTHGLRFLRASPVFFVSICSISCSVYFWRYDKSLFKSLLSIWECNVSLAPWHQLFGSCIGRSSWRVELGHWAAKVPWTYGSLFSWSKMHFRLLELLNYVGDQTRCPLLEKGDLSILCVSRASLEVEFSYLLIQMQGLNLLKWWRIWFSYRSYPRH